MVEVRTWEAVCELGAIYSKLDATGRHALIPPASAAGVGVSDSGRAECHRFG